MPLYDFDLPDGLSPAALRAHPVNHVLRDAAFRDGAGIPTKAELDALALPTAARAAVLKASKEIAARFQEGEQDEARNLADEYTAIVLGGLSEEYLDPDYRQTAVDPTDGMTPGELAAHIERVGV